MHNLKFKGLSKLLGKVSRHFGWQFLHRVETYYCNITLYREGRRWSTSIFTLLPPRGTLNPSLTRFLLHGDATPEDGVVSMYVNSTRPHHSITQMNNGKNSMKQLRLGHANETQMKKWKWKWKRNDQAEGCSIDFPKIKKKLKKKKKKQFFTSGSGFSISLSPENFETQGMQFFCFFFYSSILLFYFCFHDF